MERVMLPPLLMISMASSFYTLRRVGVGFRAWKGLHVRQPKGGVMEDESTNVNSGDRLVKFTY